MLLFLFKTFYYIFLVKITSQRLCQSSKVVIFWDGGIQKLLYFGTEGVKDNFIWHLVRGVAEAGKARGAATAEHASCRIGVLGKARSDEDGSPRAKQIQRTWSETRSNDEHVVGKCILAEDHEKQSVPPRTVVDGEIVGDRHKGLHIEDGNGLAMESGDGVVVEGGRRRLLGPDM